MDKELLNNISVLYVEDEQTVRSFTKKIISGIVKKITTASNGQEGLQCFQEQKDIDLVVTDINMPIMDGLDMAKAIREINPTMPIVITSAYNDASFLKRSIEIGINAYVMKPIDLYQLVESMAKAVEPFYLKKRLETISSTLEERVNEGIKEIKSILNSQNNLILVTNGKEIINTNKKFIDFFGPSLIDTFKSKKACISDYFLPGDDVYTHDKSLDVSWIEQIKKLANIDQMVKLKNRNDIEKVFAVNIDNYQNHTNQYYYVISFTDITDLKNKSNLLEYQANHDTLTGLYNRKKFYETYRKEMKRNKRYQGQLSLILFDLDHFKKLNDTYGHDIGDITLKQVADTSLKEIREHDTIIRWGGEEFVVLLPQTDIKNAIFVANKLRKSIESIVHPDIPIQITASFGVTLLSEDDNENSFIKRADEALYQAKNSGRNLVISRVKEPVTE